MEYTCNIVMNIYVKNSLLYTYGITQFFLNVECNSFFALAIVEFFP